MDRAVLSADVIIFYGPPHSGKSLYYKQKLSMSHDYVCPTEELQQNPDLTLRQLILRKVITPLKQGIKVVIDDENATFTKRDSYICLIQKKAAGRSVVCLSFSPQHGQHQLLWSCEFALAARAEQNEDENEDCRDTSDVIERWSGDRETLDPPRMTEGYETIEQVSTPFQIQLRFKFEVPCLLIQWEGLVRGAGTDCPVSGAQEAVSAWYKHNPGGRIVVLADHTAFNTGTLSDRDSAIKNVLSSLTSSMASCAVYALHVRNPGRCGEYSTTPHPGLIAFLQRLFYLQLTHKYSVYAYHTPPHMQMAEEAGIKHIKASRLFKHPTLAQSSNAFTTVAIPALQRNLRVVRDTRGGEDSDESPSLPLSGHAHSPTGHAHSSGSHVRQRDVGCGRMLYLFARSQADFERYAELYTSNATPANMQDSRLALLRQTSCDQASHDTSRNTSSSTSRSIPRAREIQARAERDLPRWMRPKEDTKRDYRPKLKKMTSRTIYVMTSEELLATARHVLAEGLEEESGDEQNHTTLNRSTTDQQKVKGNNITVTEVPSIAAGREENTSVQKDRSTFKRESPAQARSRRGPKSSRTSNILDYLFDDDDTGRKYKTAPAPRARRRSQGRQCRIDEYLSPTKQKVTKKPDQSAVARVPKKTETKSTFSSNQSRKPDRTKSLHAKKEIWVPETTSVEVQDNSLIFADSPDSLEISDSVPLSQETDSLIVYDSDSQEVPGGQDKKIGFTTINSKYPATTVRDLSVTTVPETEMSELKPCLSKERTYSILDGLI